MKKKDLFILNYQREIPPFLLNEIKAASPFFDTLFYVTPKLYNDNRKKVECDNVVFVVGNKFNEFISFILLPILFFSKISIKNFFDALKLKKMSFSFIKHHFIQLYETRTLTHLAKKVIKRHTSGIIMSSWFNACAISSSKIAQSNKNIFSFSFAHAFEVQPNVNPFLGCDFDSFKLRNNKEIVFISKEVRKTYIEHMTKIGIDKELLNKTSQRYLGTFKHDGSMSPKCLKYKTNIIVSCSSVVPIKRLHLIVDILKSVKTNVVWNHIGDGPLLNELKVYANKTLLNNDNISINFIGRLDNKEVIKYYIDNKVDLFINVSESEGLPVSIMESISFGIPVIATDVGGTSEIIDSKTGWLIDKDFDPQNTGYLIDVLLSNKKKLDEMKNNCFKKWEECFNIEKNAKDFYSKLLLED